MDNIIVNNKSECVYRGAGVIKSISIDCDGVDGYIIIYDGDNENGKIISRGRAISNTSFSPQLSDGIHFDKGLYIGVNAATTNYVLLVSPSKK